MMQIHVCCSTCLARALPPPPPPMPSSVWMTTVTQVVEPFFQSGMLWETWQHGPGPLPQYCPAPHSQQPFSFTVASVAVPGGAGWYVTQDHSKWGVTSDRVPNCCHQVPTKHSWSEHSVTEHLSVEHSQNCTITENYSLT